MGGCERAGAGRGCGEGVAMTGYPGRVGKATAYWPELAVSLVLLVALVVSSVAGATGVSAALLIAALPALFLAYLNEVDRWSDQGAVPLLVSLSGGALLGATWGWRVNTGGIGDGIAAGAVILLPALLAFLGSWVIHAMDQYDEVLDGMAFSAALAGGWFAGFLLVVVVPEALASADSSTWQFVRAIAPTALLLPVTVSAAAGVLVATAWVSRDPGPQFVQRRWWVLALLILVAAGLAGLWRPEFATSFLWLGLLAVVAVVIARMSLKPLLETAGEVDGG